MTDEELGSSDDGALVRPERREGDVISVNRAILTLSKSMFNAGCFSLPFAWSLAGKWSVSNRLFDEYVAQSKSVGSL